MRRAAWMLVGLGVCAGEAGAQQLPTTYALDLSTGPDSPPEFVCVTHGGATVGKGQLRLDDLLKKQLLEGNEGMFALRAGVVPTGVGPETLAAWQAMQATDAGLCGSDQPACAVRVGIAGSGHMVCARNASWTVPNGRVLVVDVRGGGGSGPPVEGVAVEGAVATLRIGETPTGEGLVARVVGGHYQSGPGVAAVGRRFALRPKARCHTRMVPLPLRAVAGGPNVLQVRLSRHGQVVAQCEHPVAATVGIALPEGVSGVPTRLEVVTGAKDSLSFAEFEAIWSTTSAPEPVVLASRAISFSWEAPCEYAGSKCPRADIRDSGMTCTSEVMPEPVREAGGKRLSCAYRCASPTGSSSALAWPARVVFRAPEGGMTWDSRLEAVGQVLNSYVPEERRSFPVRFAWEQRSEALLKRSGDRIRVVEVTTPTGVVQRIEPRDGRWVTLPGARCGDTFDSRVVGDRKFEVDTARIEEGWLVIPEVKDSADPLQVGGMIGGGFIVPASRVGLPGPSGLEARAYGTAQLGFRLQPDPREDKSALVPRAYELQLSYVIAQQPFFPLHAPDEAVEEDAEYLAFNRWVLEAMPMWQLGQRTQLGVGMGVGLGFPVRKMDESAVGKSRLFFVPLTALGRIQVSRAVSIEGSFRVMGPEKVYRYEPSLFFAGTPERTEETLWSAMLGLVGVRVLL